MGDRCRVHRIATTDLDRSVDDPALGLLLAEGWTVVAPIAVEEKGGVFIALIMAPPRQREYQWKSITAFSLILLVVIIMYTSLYNGVTP